MGSLSSKPISTLPIPTSSAVAVPERLNKYGLLPLNFQTQRSSQTLQDQFPIDIVAIHGLTGDAYTTWTDQSNQSFWLRDFLPAQFPGARIFSFGYPADIFFSLGTGDFETFARTLLEDIKGVRRHSEVCVLKILESIMPS